MAKEEQVIQAIINTIFGWVLFFTGLHYVESQMMIEEWPGGGVIVGFIIWFTGICLLYQGGGEDEGKKEGKKA